MIDTHIHLDDLRYSDDLEDVLDRARAGGVKQFIIPGADPQTLPRAVEIAKRYDDVFFAVGIHPYDAENFDLSLFDEFIKDPKCVAVGECGLDYYRLPDDEDEKVAQKELQKDIFIKQIEIAKKYNKPLIVHIRDASRDSKEILLKYDASVVGGVLHCFNADDELLSLSEQNFYFGIGGVVTFKNAKKLVNILPKIPLDKMLVETDGPYLTPTPHRGERNEPFYTTFVAKKISQLLNIDYKKIDEITTKNAKEVFKI